MSRGEFCVLLGERCDESTAASVSPRRGGERRPKRGYWALPPNGEGCYGTGVCSQDNTAHSAVGNLKDLKEL